MDINEDDTMDDGYDDNSLYQDLGYHDDASNSQFDITDNYLDEDNIQNSESSQNLYRKRKGS